MNETKDLMSAKSNLNDFMHAFEEVEKGFEKDANVFSFFDDFYQGKGRTLDHNLARM